MNNTLLGALLGVGGTLLSVLVGGLLTLCLTFRQHRQERQSIRALLSLELLQNSTKLLALSTSLHLLLDNDASADPSRLAMAFLSTAVPLSWEQQRWYTDAVGRHLTSSELLRLGEWYTQLDGLTFLHTRLIEQFRHVTLSDGGGAKLAIPPAMTRHVGYARQSLKGFLEYVDDLSTHPPILPDAKMNRGETIQEYLKDLAQRSQSPTAEETGSTDVA